MRSLLFCLLTLAFSVPAHAAERWVAQTEHFIVYSEGKEAEVQEFAQRLERYDKAMRYMQKLPVEKQKSSPPLTIYRFGEPSDMAALAGASGSGIAGFFIPRASGPVAFVPIREERQRGSVGTRSNSGYNLTGEGVLFHEYAHYFMMNYFAAAYPSWYVEGFAEVYGATELVDNGAFRIGGVAKHRGAELLWLPSYPMAKLFAPEKDRKGEDRYRNYSVGWLMTHYLTFDKSRQGQLRAYLNGMNQGKSSLESAKTAFGDLDKLGKDLRSYLGSRLMGIEVKPDNYVAPTVKVRPMTPGESDIFRLKARSEAGVSKSSAKGVASDIRRIATRYANDPFVQTALAEAELDATNLDASDAAADRAIQLDPQAVAPLLFKGKVAMKRAATDKSYYAVARNWFTKAYKLKPDNAEALVLNYRSFDKTGQTIPESAIIGLEHAFELAPFDAELRLLLSRQLLREGKLKSARAVAVPVAFSAHAGKSQEAAQKVVESVDANKGADALDAVNKYFEEQEKEQEK